MRTRNFFGRSFIKNKAQSAMEYLMTYGWAILIIAIVLAALFQLGVFNPMAFAPKAPPGACQVFRPNGPGTTSFINLEGVCNGELPQYVASFSSGNLAGPMPTPYSNSFTLNIWLNHEWGKFFELASGTCDESGAWTWGYYDDEGTSGTGGFSISPGNINTNIWNMVSLVGENGNLIVYINGQPTNSITASTTLTYSNIFSIGGSYWCSGIGGGYTGLVSNDQLYNTSLSADEIQALYQEGIGGAPINLQNLVGWWPLNGNANDYSGNDYNLLPENGIINYVSNWYSGYTSP